MIGCAEIVKPQEPGATLISFAVSGWQSLLSGRWKGRVWAPCDGGRFYLHGVLAYVKRPDPTTYSRYSVGLS